MSILVHCFRGQGVRVDGRGYGTIHSFVSPTEVSVKFRNGIETIRIADLLPVNAFQEVATRYRNIELKLPPLKFTNRDEGLEPELSDEEPLEDSDKEEAEEEQYAEEK